MGHGLRSGRLADWPPAVRAIRELRRYNRSPQAAADTPQEREARLRAGFDQALRHLGLEDDTTRQVLQPVLDDAIGQILKALAEEVDVEQEPVGGAPAAPGTVG